MTVDVGGIWESTVPDPADPSWSWSDELVAVASERPDELEHTMAELGDNALPEALGSTAGPFSAEQRLLVCAAHMRRA